jgi:hypothetical protein
VTNGRKMLLASKAEGLIVWIYAADNNTKDDCCSDRCPEFFEKCFHRRKFFQLVKTNGRDKQAISYSDKR